MTRAGAVLLLILGASLPANADVRDDLAHAVAAQKAGEGQRAISLYSGILGRGELSADLAAVAHNNRALALMAAGQPNRALEDYDAGLTHTQRLLTLDPWHETAHQHRMMLLARSGRRSAALVQYDTCRRLLADELGVQPMAETTELYARIRPSDVDGVVSITLALVNRLTAVAAIAMCFT